GGVWGGAARGVVEAAKRRRRAGILRMGKPRVFDTQHWLKGKPYTGAVAHGIAEAKTHESCAAAGMEAHAPTSRLRMPRQRTGSAHLNEPIRAGRGIGKIDAPTRRVLA